MKKRILFVDDEQAILDCYKDIMSPKKTVAAGFLGMLTGGAPVEEPECAYDCVFLEQGLAAVEEVRRGQEEGKPFSVIFLDMRMPPGIDGLETARRIRKIDTNAIFVCMVSAAAECTFNAAFQATGDHNVVVLRKPFSSEEIYAILEAH